MQASKKPRTIGNFSFLLASCANKCAVKIRSRFTDCLTCFAFHKARFEIESLLVVVGTRWLMLSLVQLLRHVAPAIWNFNYCFTIGRKRRTARSSCSLVCILGRTTELSSRICRLFWTLESSKGGPRRDKPCPFSLSFPGSGSSSHSRVAIVGLSLWTLVEAVCLLAQEGAFVM